MPPSVQRSVLVADRVLYWRLENRLHELGPAILEAFDRATASIEALWAAPPSAPQLLHGDLTPHNVMVDGDRLIPIDFQDAVWGLDVQDLALSMVSLGQVDSSGDLAPLFGWATSRFGRGLTFHRICSPPFAQRGVFISSTCL